jgi:hypothetical protein
MIQHQAIDVRSGSICYRKIAARDTSVMPPIATEERTSREVRFVNMSGNRFPLYRPPVLMFLAAVRLNIIVRNSWYLFTFYRHGNFSMCRNTASWLCIVHLLLHLFVRRSCVFFQE